MTGQSPPSLVYSMHEIFSNTLKVNVMDRNISLDRALWPRAKLCLLYEIVENKWYMYLSLKSKFKMPSYLLTEHFSHTISNRDYINLSHFQCTIAEHIYCRQLLMCSFFYWKSC